MKTTTMLVVLAVVLAALGVWQWEWDSSGLARWIGQHPVQGALAYVALFAASVVVMPFSSLPLLPLATRSFGVVTTALLSTAGWWLGCLLAFQIARLGSRYLERITSLQGILPFSLVWSYAGGQLGAGRSATFVAVVVAVAALALLLRRAWEKRR